MSFWLLPSCKVQGLLLPCASNIGIFFTGVESYTQKNVKQLADVHLCAACWIYGSHYNQATHSWDKSSHHYCSELNWQALSVCWEYLSFLSVHDILHGCFSLIFSFISSRTRSHSLFLCCKSSTTNFYIFVFVNNVFLCNMISYSILSITDCKNRLYQFLTL